MSNSWFKTRAIADSVLLIQEPLKRLAPDYLTNTVNMFVVHDKNEALLIDCGTGVYSIVDELLPVLPTKTILTPFITHNHWDHVGSLYEFETALMHQADAKKLAEEENLDHIREDVLKRNEPISSILEKPYTRKPFSGEAIHVKNGEWIQVGKLELQIIHLPGHTPGSIGLWHPDEKFMFVGDAFQTGCVYADEKPKEFFRTLEKLSEWSVGTYFMPAHEDILLQEKDLDELIEIFSTYEKQTHQLIQIKNRYLDNLLLKGERFSLILPKN